MEKILVLITMLFLSQSALSGKTTLSPVTLVQPMSTGTYVSNCAYQTNSENNDVIITSCITDVKCGSSGKWFFIPVTNENHDAFVSVALASAMGKFPVLISGDGSCTSKGNEDVLYIMSAN